MTAFLVLLAVLSVAGIAASVHLVRTDGYGPVADRSSVRPHRPRPSTSGDPFESRFQSLSRSGRDWNRDSSTAQIR